MLWPLRAFMKENFADSEKNKQEIISSEPNFAPAWNNLALCIDGTKQG